MHQERGRRGSRRLAGDPIHFESEEFNDTFHVTCDDRRFASALIDPQMMQFLLETKGAVGFETMGRFVLLISHQIPPDEMPILLGLADAVRQAHPARGLGAVPEARPGRARAPPADAGRRRDRRRRARRCRGTRRRASTTTSTATR